MTAMNRMKFLNICATSARVDVASAPTVVHSNQRYSSKGKKYQYQIFRFNRYTHEIRSGEGINCERAKILVKIKCNIFGLTAVNGLILRNILIVHKGIIYYALFFRKRDFEQKTQIIFITLMLEYPMITGFFTVPFVDNVPFRQVVCPNDSTHCC